MAVNVKMGVDLSSFNSGIREGQNILKGLNAEMKATEAEFKATGNYQTKGVWRATEDCRMRTNASPDFCPVCEEAIRAMVRFYTGD